MFDKDGVKRKSVPRTNASLQSSSCADTTDPSDQTIGRSLVVLALLGMVFSLWWSRDAFLELSTALDASNWPTVSAQVLSADVEFVYTGHSTPSYHLPRVRYSYKVNGQVYMAERIQFARLELKNRSGKRAAEAIRARYAPANTVKAYYNPADPAQAVLEPGITRHVLRDIINPLLALLLSLCLGLTGWWFLMPAKAISMRKE